MPLQLLSRSSSETGDSQRLSVELFLAEKLSIASAPTSIVWYGFRLLGMLRDPLQQRNQCLHKSCVVRMQCADSFLELVPRRIVMSHEVLDVGLISR